MSLPFTFSPLFVFPSVFSSHFLFKPQPRSSLFLPSHLPCPMSSDKHYCTVSHVSCKALLSKTAPAVVRAVYAWPESTESTSTNGQQLQVILGTKQSPHMNLNAGSVQVMYGEWATKGHDAPGTEQSHEKRFTKGREMHRAGHSLYSTARRMQKAHQCSVTPRSEPVNRKAKKTQNEYSRKKLQILFCRNQKH